MELQVLPIVFVSWVDFICEVLLQDVRVLIDNQNLLIGDRLCSSVWIEILMKF